MSIYIKPQFFILAMISTFLSLQIQANPYFGFKKINIWGELALASPAKELKNYYSDGNPLKIYIGADLPFLFLNYGKKTSTGLSMSIFGDHENANFTDKSYATDGLTVKIYSVGARIRPFANMAIYSPKGKVVDGNIVVETQHKSYGRDEFGNSNYREYTTTQTYPRITNEGAKAIFSLIFSGLYFDWGISNISLVEAPNSTIKRNGTLFSIGCAPTIGVGKKITAYVDLSVRNYKWTNNMHTSSGVQSFHTGFGLGIKL